MDVRILLRQGIPELSFVSQIGLNVAQRVQDLCPEPPRSFRTPPDHFLVPPPLPRDAVGIAPTFLERHLQRPREAIESFGYLIRADVAHALPRHVRLVRYPALHVGIRSLVRGQEGAVECFRTPPPDGRPLRPREEDERQSLVAVHVEEGVDARPVHLSQDVVHLRRSLERRRLVAVRGAASLPFPTVVVVLDGAAAGIGRGDDGDGRGRRRTPLPIEIAPRRVGSEVSHDRPVGVHVRHDAEGVHLPSPYGDLVVRRRFPRRSPPAAIVEAEEPPEQSLREEGRHRFAGMLTVYHPACTRSGPERDAFDLASH